MRLLRMTSDVTAKINEAKAEADKIIHEAYKVKSEKEAKAIEMYHKAQQLDNEANEEYRKEIAKARKQYAEQYDKIIAEAYEKQHKEDLDKAKKEKEMYSKRFSELSRDEIADPFIRLLHDIIVTGGMVAPEREEDTKENNNVDVAKMSESEKVNYIIEGMNEADSLAKAYYGLLGARVIKTRAEHVCECCGQIIPAGTLAVVGSVWVDKDSELTLKTSVDNDDMVEYHEDIGKFISNDVDSEEDGHVFSPVKCWFTIDCAVEAINKAFNF